MRIAKKIVISLTGIIGVVIGICCILNIDADSDAGMKMLGLYALFPILFLAVGYGFKFAEIEGSSGKAAGVCAPFGVMIFTVILPELGVISIDLWWNMIVYGSVFVTTIAIMILEHHIFNAFTSRSAEE